jgi:hypothetical protein
MVLLPQSTSTEEYSQEHLLTDWQKLQVWRTGRDNLRSVRHSPTLPSHPIWLRRLPQKWDRHWNLSAYSALQELVDESFQIKKSSWTGS